ncbi:alpha/beta hydrolase [Pseudonocardia aurantiaca]|uniref:Alpha/beta fold hydrolase n=1 Tax=Pseudonocardia aurantiaca TaxID=75290 RepID=A0ABW4FSU5_9PSEU
MHTSSTKLRSALLAGAFSAVLALGLATVTGTTAQAATPADPAPAAHAAPAQAAPKPTIVLVHGAFADASSWNGEVDALQRDGYVVRAIDNPLRGLTSDAEEVKDFLSTIEGPIVLVGHSYGGAVITNAAAGNPNVKALVYVDAAAPDVGETNGQLSGKTSALSGNPATLFDSVPYAGGPAGAVQYYLKENIFLHNFAPDLPARTAEQLWATQRPAATAAFDTPSAAAAWKTIPSWYVIGMNDQIITPQSELAMAQRAHSHIVEVPGGSHLTLISHPVEVTNQILAAAQSVH